MRFALSLFFCTSKFLLFLCFPHINELFPLFIGCNPDLFSFKRFMTFEQCYTTVAFIHQHNKKSCIRGRASASPKTKMCASSEKMDITIHKHISECFLTKIINNTNMETFCFFLNSNYSAIY